MPRGHDYSDDELASVVRGATIKDIVWGYPLTWQWLQYRYALLITTLEENHKNDKEKVDFRAELSPSYLLFEDLSSMCREATKIWDRCCPNWEWVMYEDEDRPEEDVSIPFFSLGNKKPPKELVPKLTELMQSKFNVNEVPFYYRRV